MTIYKVPPTPETEDTLCMKITIPDTREYRVAFWTAIYHFTKWVAWERDGTDRAKRAAAVWKPIVEANRVLYENGEVCGECAMQIRQNPTNPCQLQTSDDGIDWVTVADFSSCADAAQGTIPDWPLYYTAPAGGKPADQLNAERIIAQYKYLLDTAVVYWGYSPSQWENTVAPATIPDWQVWFKPGWNQIYNQLHAAYPTLAAYQADLANVDWDAMRDAVICVNEYAFAEQGHWLDRTADLIFEFLNDSASAIFQSLTGMAATLQGDSLSQYNALYKRTATTPPTWGGVSCEWTQDFDFTVSSSLWVVSTYYDGDISQGEWVSGLGFRSTFGTSITGIGDERVTIRRLFDASRVTSFTVWYTLETPYHPSANGALLFDGNENAFAMTGGNQSEAVTGDIEVSEAKAIINGGLWDDPYPPYIPSGQKCYITAAQLTGIGTNPFTI